MNAYSHEMREVLKGRDIINFSSLDKTQMFQYWLARLIGGGGLGIFGDLVYQEAEEKITEPMSQMLYLDYQ